MQEPSPSWDPYYIDAYFDLSTKVAVLYLFVSAIAFVVLAIRFVPVLRRLGVAETVRRVSVVGAPTSETASQETLDEAHPTEWERVRIATINLRKWAQLTTLIMLAFTANELTDMFSGIASSKMTGVSAISGTLAHIFSLWAPAIWFVAALCLASWLLKYRSARSGISPSRATSRT